ncbi:YqcI/YcgG family protein [Janibacter sp. YIM B02568]|uniref:guanitoxin biosynthesis heme-dependent pre-guanitoxin N-hydroxylase GntA n=1 Tax=Janibacter endophyticus TaxID=2806261 RepID=UPI001951BBEE|nr:guanitoxin biosynthesis heme-dependent pre-guanitoxin N-hydroxylase GntA [Janibacter endophyticus]MBM6545509.1 YqcI/YcgG family protein [Janibacter endophyticus]
MGNAHEPLEDVLAEQADSGLDDAPDIDVVGAIADMVAHPEFPCLGARSVFRRDAATVVVLDDLESELSRTELSRALAEYGRAADPTGAFVSFVAVFRGPQIRDEVHFERLLWDLLQRLHDEDEEPWAHGVDDDPDKAHFAYSHAGVAYFIVGLHPQASRIARRAPLPTLVFNLHEQFELLRGEGSFERMRDTIRRRDAALQGEVNPMAQDHGESSEARQYAGRRVEDDWAAPFATRGDT